MSYNNQIPQSIVEQDLNNKISVDFSNLQINITIYVYKVINLQLSELKNYTIQENSLNILRFDPIYFKKVKVDDKEVDCNWFDAFQTNEERTLVPIESGNQNDISLNNITKININFQEPLFLNNIDNQDFILFSVGRPLEDCRVENTNYLYYCSKLSFLDNSVKKDKAFINLFSISALKIAKNSRLIFIPNKINEYANYKLNGLIITKPIETIIDTVQVIGYREGLAEEYSIPLSIEENVFTYVKFQVADENEVVSLYFDWIDAYKILSFFYFTNKIELINPFTDVFNKEYNTNFWKAFLFTLCFSYVYNDGFSYLSSDYNTQKKMKNYDDYFYVLLNNSKNNISSACDNWISNQIFSVPYTKNTNDWMKYKSIVLMCNQFLYSSICFKGGFNETQKLFIPFYFNLNTSIDRTFLNNTLDFDASRTDDPILKINNTNIEVSLDSTFFNFEYDNDLKEYILKPYWTDISDKPLIGFVPSDKRMGWNEIKGKYLTIDNPLKKQNYLENLVDLDKLSNEELKYLGIIFFDKKEDLSRFWKYRNDNEYDKRIISFSNDFGEDKSKDTQFLLEYTTNILKNQGYSIKSIEIFGTPSSQSTYTKYTLNGWVYYIRDLLKPAYDQQGIQTYLINNKEFFLTSEQFKKKDLLSRYGMVYNVYSENNQTYIDVIGIYTEAIKAWAPQTWTDLAAIEPIFWTLKGSNFWATKIKYEKGDKDNWLNPTNPYFWWTWSYANVRTDYPSQITFKLGNINLVLYKKIPIKKITYEGNEYFSFSTQEFYNASRDLLKGALFPEILTNWNVNVVFNANKGTINDFNVIYNRQNWLSYFFQLNPSYITGKKTMDFKILFKESKNFKLTKVKNIKIRGIWGGDFDLKIRYIDDKGVEYIENIKTDSTKESFVLFDNSNERITETNINFV